MPRPPKGQLSLGEIRNMARQHNKVSAIKNIDGLSRKALVINLISKFDGFFMLLNNKINI